MKKGKRGAPPASPSRGAAPAAAANARSAAAQPASPEAAAAATATPNPATRATAAPAAVAPQRTLGVLAEGFGVEEAGSQAITELALAQRLTAIACRAAAPAWPQLARRLKLCPKAVQIGFSFTLTEGQPLSAELRRVWPQFPRREALLLDALRGRLPLDALRTEWRAQWLAFTGYAGRAPQFVTSGDLVHGLAGVRETMLAAIRSEAPPPWVLHTGRVLGPGLWLRRRLLEDTGGRKLMQQLQALKWPHPPALLGLSDGGRPGAEHGAQVRAWLNEVPPEGAVLLCEPAREHERAYFASAAFAADLQSAGLRLGNPLA